jgi:ribosomal protein S18 acetylase RimI-like enzyme
MIKLIPVSDFRELNQNIRQIYDHSFPSDERRDWQDLKSLFGQPDYTFYHIWGGGGMGLIGFITTWNLKSCVFIEHFALEETARGKGVGSQVLSHLLKSTSNRVVLEVEEATTEQNRRRISFYERLGFSACDSIYWQPPYSNDKNKVKMLLMSYPDKIRAMEFEEIKKELYLKVYKVND